MPVNSNINNITTNPSLTNTNTGGSGGGGGGTTYTTTTPLVCNTITASGSITTTGDLTLAGALYLPSSFLDNVGSNIAYWGLTGSTTGGYPQIVLSTVDDPFSGTIKGISLLTDNMPITLGYNTNVMGALSTSGNITTSGTVSGTTGCFSTLAPATSLTPLTIGGNNSITIQLLGNIGIKIDSTGTSISSYPLTGTTINGNLRIMGALSTSGNITTSGTVSGTTGCFSTLAPATSLTPLTIGGNNSITIQLLENTGIKIDSTGTSISSYQETGTTIHGNLQITGAIVCNNSLVANVLSGNSITSSGNIRGNSITSTGAISAGSVTASGTITAGSVTTGSVTASGTITANGFISTATGGGGFFATSVASTLMLGNNVMDGNNPSGQASSQARWAYYGSCLGIQTFPEIILSQDGGNTYGRAPPGIVLNPMTYPVTVNGNLIVKSGYPSTYSYPGSTGGGITCFNINITDVGISSTPTVTIPYGISQPKVPSWSIKATVWNSQVVSGFANYNSYTNTISNQSATYGLTIGTYGTSGVNILTGGAGTYFVSCQISSTLAVSQFTYVYYSESTMQNISLGTGTTGSWQGIVYLPATYATGIYWTLGTTPFRYTQMSFSGYRISQ